jgi:hypothetical protein
MSGIMMKLLIIGLPVSMLLLLSEYQVLAQLDGVNFGGLGDITEGIRKFLAGIFDSKPLDKISDTECIVSTLTGGKSGITKSGQLIIGSHCDDNIVGDSENEIIYSLDGIDKVFAGNGNDIIYGGVGDNRLYGEGNDDIIIPGDGSNIVDGGIGDDILFGMKGNSLLIGDKGNDELIAGNGSTIMDGGSGANSYECNSNSIVLDYNPDNGDVISGKCKIISNNGRNFSSHINDTSLNGD